MDLNMSSPLQLGSFRDGATFDVVPLNYGGIKAVSRAGAGDGDDMDSLDAMIYETLKRAFPDVAMAEIDNLEQTDLMVLIDVLTVNSELESLGFTPPNSSGE